MQTAIRISQGKSGGTHYPLDRRIRHPKRDLGTKKKDTAATGRHNAFLTGRITPFAPDFWQMPVKLRSLCKQIYICL